MTLPPIPPEREDRSEALAEAAAESVALRARNAALMETIASLQVLLAELERWLGLTSPTSFRPLATP